MRFAADLGQTLTQLREAYAGGGLTDDFHKVAGEVVPYQAIWGLVELRNGSADGLSSSGSRILASDILGLIALDVQLLRAQGGTERLLAHDIRAPFDPAHYSATRLRSAPFMLAPGEQALLAVRMVHGAAEELALSLEDPEIHRSTAFADGLKLTAFYAFMASCLVFFLVFSIAMRSYVEFAYALLFIFGLGFLAYLDNFLFRWLYPALPGIHLPVGLVMLLALVALGFFAAGLSLKRYSTHKNHAGPVFRVALVVLCSIALVFVLPVEILAQVAYVLLAVMLVTQGYCVARWDVYDGARRRVVRWVTFVAIAGFGAAVVLALVRTGTGGLSLPWLIKGTYAVLALGLMSGLSIGLIEMRREHAAALAREIAAVRKEAAVKQELLQAERNYSRVRDLADRRRLQLATMSHDIKQPLGALRLTVETMTREDSSQARERLQEAFDYIEELALSHLEETREEQGECEQDAPIEQEEKTDPYSLSLVLDTVGQMFGGEARSKGLELKVVSSSVPVSVPPLALMRIVSNLVSNAIKYTGSGKVLTGARRRAGYAELQVIDTGPGMSEAELVRYRRAWQSRKDSEGHGLGLSICAELAAEHGLEMEIASRPGRGTMVSLRITVYDAP
ncbi:MAG: hypothetical protein Tsb0019_07930 [Roseibium sp.]